MQREDEPARDARGAGAPRASAARRSPRRALAAVLLVAALSLAMALAGAAAGGGEDPGPEPVRLTFRSDGTLRSALVVPARSADPSPVVLAFHGLGSSGERLLGDLGSFPRRSGATLVLPDALPCVATGGHPCWPLGTESLNRPLEEAFVERLLDRVAGRWPIARNRVYALGLSNGAGWALHLVLQRPRVVRGAIVVAGYDPTRRYSREVGRFLDIPLKPLTPTTVLAPGTFRPVAIHHGTADAVIGYDLILELVATLQAAGWPTDLLRVQALQDADHHDPRLLEPAGLLEDLEWLEKRSGARRPRADRRRSDDPSSLRGRRRPAGQPAPEPSDTDQKGARWDLSIDLTCSPATRWGSCWRLARPSRPSTRPAT